MASFELIAHRGASGYAPENTLAAFRLALEMGAKSIEFDVQQTTDHRLAVIHDPSLRRLAGEPKNVRDLPYEQLSRFDVGSWFDEGFKGEKVPLLEEVLDLAEGRAELQLEIKNGPPAYPGIEERVVDMLRARPAWRGKVAISSFDHQSLYLVRTLDAGIRLGYLVGITRRHVALREAKELRCESVHMSQRQADKAWAKALHAAGMRMLVYTVNTKKDLDRVRGLGADGVFTNFPDVDRPAPALAALKRGR